MRRSKTWFDTWKRLLTALIVCTMLFSNVSGTVRALEDLGDNEGLVQEEQDDSTVVETSDEVIEEELEDFIEESEEAALEEEDSEDIFEEASEEEPEQIQEESDDEASVEEQKSEDTEEVSEDEDAPEQVPEEETQESEEVSYPALKFVEKANQVNVNVSAPEGAFPEGTTMKVKPIS